MSDEKRIASPKVYTYTIKYGFADKSNKIAELECFDRIECKNKECRFYKSYFECLKEAMHEYNQYYQKNKDKNPKHIKKIKVHIIGNYIEIDLTSMVPLTKNREAAALNLLTRILVEKENSSWPGCLTDTDPGKMFRSAE